MVEKGSIRQLMGSDESWRQLTASRGSVSRDQSSVWEEAQSSELEAQYRHELARVV